jgi:hypothetical protein
VSAQPLDPCNGVEPSIEAEDRLDTVLPHYGDMESIARRESPARQEFIARTLHRAEIDRQHLVDDRQEHVESRLNRVGSVDCSVPMQDLLEYLGVGDQLIPIGDKALHRPLRIDLVGVSRADEVHRNIRVDKNHEGPEYPDSIS